MPNQSQQWPSQPGWNRPPNAWTGSVQPPGQYPPAPPTPPQPNYQPPPAPGTPPGASSQQVTYGPPGGYYPTPPAKKNPLLAVLGGGAFVLIAMFFGMALINYLSAGGSGNPSTEPTYHQVENVPAPDFNPPALPKPTNVDQLRSWTKDNPIYQQSTPVPTNCVVPHQDPTTATAAELETRLNKLTACLWGVWEKPVIASGFELPRTPVTVYSQTITTPCGKIETHNAYYCSADQHVYFAHDIFEVLPATLRAKPWIVDYVMAHEFGHHLQGRTGIMNATDGLQANSAKLLAIEYNRRMELQADCFSGLWINSVGQASQLSAADVEDIKKIAAAVGSAEPDPEDNHGASSSRMAWVTAGMGSSQVGTCNSYVAPANEVR